MLDWRDADNSWIMFDHIQCLADGTTLAFNVYDSKYCVVSSVIYCDMKPKDDATHALLWEKLNSVLMKNGMSNLKFKDFMVDNSHAN